LQHAVRLDVCPIEPTSPAFLNLRRQRLNPPHEQHELDRSIV